ncbi:MAG TPA: Mur ligase family protein, partial [Gammaproteobacteria bacterium]
DRARDGEALTYFEFGTLTALDVFRRRGVDVAVLEVGLGGRLDAVNAVDADVAAVVSIGLDHVDWLGGEIEGIAREKAGIFRRNRPAVFGSTAVPKSIVDVADSIGAHLRILGRDFQFECHAGSWTWRDASRSLQDLPLPPLAGAHQFGNAATAISAVLALEPEIPVAAIRAGLLATRLAGRLQRLDEGAGPAAEIVVDVGHNPDAAARIAEFLLAQPKPTTAVLAMLADKDAAGFVRELAPLVDRWHLASLSGERGRSAGALALALESAGLPVVVQPHSTVAGAAETALAQAPPNGRVLVLGSFHTVAEFLVYFDARLAQSGTGAQTGK